MDYASQLEQRAMQYDIEPSEICQSCGHPYHFHVSARLEEYPCDFEIKDDLCGCKEFIPSEVIA